MFAAAGEGSAWTGMLAGILMIVSAPIVWKLVPKLQHFTDVDFFFGRRRDSEAVDGLRALMAVVSAMLVAAMGVVCLVVSVIRIVG